MSWTDERVELLRQLWLEGRSASQISAVLGAGLTRNAVIGKVHRLGLAGRAKAPGAQPATPTTAAAAAKPVSAPPRRAGAASMVGSAAPMSGSHPIGSMSSPTAVGATMMHGNTALAMATELVEEAQPMRVAHEVVVPMSVRVTIVDLKESMCKWPLGDPTSADFRYCGSSAYGTTPYCQHHGKLAYQPVQDRRRDRDKRMLLK